MQTNQDIFKQAIAEAKSIRDAAILNAKESIEESLTPHLKELLAAKLREMEEEEDDLVEGEDVEEETVEEASEEKVVAEEDSEENEEEEAEDDTEESEDDAEESEEEIDLEDLTMDDLRDMIRDIVAQETAPGSDMDMGMDMDVDTELPQEPGVDDMVGLDEPPSDEEEIDLDELLSELEGLTETSKHKNKKTISKSPVKESKSAVQVKKVQADLTEAMKTIKQLRKDLSEVNLLNSKLLFVNKIFKSKHLSEAQKAQVIATFDRAQTTREAKLVYESFVASLAKQSLKPTNKNQHKSFASKPTGTSSIVKENRTKEVINDVSEQVLRMQKLAGILK